MVLYVLANLFYTGYCSLMYGKKFRSALGRKYKSSHLKGLLPFIPEKFIFIKSKKKELLIYDSNGFMNFSHESIFPSSRNNKIFFSQENRPETEKVRPIGELHLLMKEKYLYQDYIGSINDFIIDVIANKEEKENHSFLSMKVDFSFSSKIDGGFLVPSCWATESKNSSSVVFLPDLKCFRDEITTSEHISSRKDLADYKKQLEKEYPEVDISVLESPNLVSFCELLEKLSELKSIPELELIL